MAAKTTISARQLKEKNKNEPFYKIIILSSTPSVFLKEILPNITTWLCFLGKKLL